MIKKWLAVALTAVVLLAPAASAAQGRTVTCPLCGEKTAEIVESFKPTCTTAGMTVYHCSGADAALDTFTVEREPLGHLRRFVRWEVVPSCSAEGLALWSCDRCGDEWYETSPADPDAHIWVSTGISVPADCLTEGFDAFRCVSCGQEKYVNTPVTEHQYGDWQVTLNPTPTSCGVTTRTCQSCGHTDSRGVYPNGTLFGGDEGREVAYLQNLLIAAGYNPGTASGTFDEATVAAVCAFQRDNGLDVNGIGWPGVVSRLEAAALPALPQTEGAAQKPIVLEIDGEGCPEDVCSEHLAVQGQASAAVAAAEAKGQALGGAKAAQQIWNERLDALYTACLDAAQTPEAYQVVQCDRDLFYDWLGAYRDLLQETFPDNQLAQEQCVARVLEHRCLDFCREQHGVPLQDACTLPATVQPVSMHGDEAFRNWLAGHAELLRLLGVEDETAVTENLAVLARDRAIAG